MEDKSEKARAEREAYIKEYNKRVLERNKTYEERFKSYLYKGDFERFKAICGDLNTQAGLRFKVVDSGGKELKYNLDEFLEMLNKQFDLMTFQKL